MSDWPETNNMNLRFLSRAQAIGARPMLMETEPGMLVCNNYDVLLPNRPAMSVAVTLEDPMCESVAAQFGCSSRADHCGLVFVSGLVDGPPLRQVVAKLLRVFFREVRGLVPALSLLPPVIGDGNLEKV